MPIQLIIRNPLDRDAREYIQRAGVTDAAGRAQINEFVRGVKALGLWANMVCWPLRSTQNSGGTSTTAFSLGGLGTFNGTLVNGPVWGVDGMTFGNSTTARIDVLNVGATAATVSWYAVRTRPGTQTSNYNAIIGSGTAGSRISFLSDKDGSDRFILAHYGGQSPAGTFESGWRGVLGVSKWQSGSLTARLETNGFAQETAHPGFIATQNINRITLGYEPQSLSGNFSYAGTISFGAFFTTDLSNQFATLTNIYKQTLGTGLGLP
jgi:hypothetical protein